MEKVGNEAVLPVAVSSPPIPTPDPNLDVPRLTVSPTLHHSILSMIDVESDDEVFHDFAATGATPSESQSTTLSAPPNSSSLQCWVNKIWSNRAPQNVVTRAKIPEPSLASPVASRTRSLKRSSSSSSTEERYNDQRDRTSVSLRKTMAKRREENKSKRSKVSDLD